MKRIFRLFVVTITATLLMACSSSLKYINATYQYYGKVNGNTYRMQITLKDDGTALLEMLDKPIIEHLGDYELNTLYNDGITGWYDYSETADCYYLICYGEQWYDLDALDFVKKIYLGNDGYLYFGKKVFMGIREGYKNVDGEIDAKNHSNRGPRYQKVE